MTKSKNHRSQQLLIVGLLFMTLFAMIVGQQCENDDDIDADVEMKFEDADSKEGGTMYSNTNTLKQLSNSKISKEDLEKINNDLSESKIVEKLSAEKGMETVKNAVDKSRKLPIVPTNYKSTCPEITIWYRPSQYSWVYINTNADGSKTYRICYNYWYIYRIECACNYCRINYYSHYYDRRYRCMQENRYEWIPMKCYSFKVTKDGKTSERQWDRQLTYRYILLSKGCCCRYWDYYYKSNSQQCAIPS